MERKNAKLGTRIRFQLNKDLEIEPRMLTFNVIHIPHRCLLRTKDMKFRFAGLRRFTMTEKYIIMYVA